MKGLSSYHRGPVVCKASHIYYWPFAGNLQVPSLDRKTHRQDFYPQEPRKGKDERNNTNVLLDKREANSRTVWPVHQ